MPRQQNLVQLPTDLQQTILSHLNQSDIAHLATSCQTFNHLSKPILQRTFRCVSCHAPLFPPQELQLSGLNVLRRDKRSYGPTSKLPQRSFFELVPRTERKSLAQLGLRLDTRRGAANFHVIRHLAKTVYSLERFPLPSELQAVRALRCSNCDVFVGFRHDLSADRPTRDFVHDDFVELVDQSDNLVNLAGDAVAEPAAVVRCANSECAMQLFRREDMLPWSHVLASTRLTDMDAYLEWDHSWAGAATASQPAFFVKRMSEKAVVVRRERAERLRQGAMEVADVHCAGCDAQIGWKFVREIVEEEAGLLHNYDQVGRFGIIRTACTPSEPRYNI